MFGFNKPDAAPDTTPAVEPITPVAPVPEPEGLDRIQNLLDNNTNPDKPDESISPEEDTPFNPVELLSSPEMLDKLTSSLDFQSAISSETQQKLADQTPDAIISLVQDVSRESYKAALKHSSILTQQTIDDRLARQDKATQSKISDSLGKHELHRELPELNNPILSMAVEGFQAKLQQQNPTMTTEQVASETRNYVTELSKAFNPASPSTPKPGEEEIDWLEELGL